MKSRFISIKEVRERVGFSTSTLYRMERKGLFPSRRRLSQCRVGYPESEIDAWMEARAKVFGDPASTQPKRR